MFFSYPSFDNDVNLDNKVALFGSINSQTADIPMFQAAWKMDEQKKPREEIWNKTGWFKGPDGMWRYEIDDSGMKVQFGKGLLGDLVKSEELNKAYPGLLNTPVEIKKHGLLDFHEPIGSNDWSGIKAQVDNEEEARSILAHELQHSIQNIEGLNPGAWPKGYIPGQLIPPDAYWQYITSPGEAESRAVQKRLNMTPQQRRDTPPWLNWEYWK